jgi:hypothetical protein
MLLKFEPDMTTGMRKVSPLNFHFENNFKEWISLQRKIEV